MGSCTYPTYVTEECKFNKKTVDLVVTQDKWTFDEGVNQYYCHFNVPELTKDVCDYGEISVSHEYNSGTKNAYQVALPETSYKQVYIEDTDSTTVPYYYQQHIDYAFGEGFVEVFCIISDFYYDDFTPEGMLFRLQLTY